MLTPSANNAENTFQSPFMLTGECRLHNYCSNELGHFLNVTANALIGNPLRVISFDGLELPQKSVCTNTATSLGLNCTERYISLTNDCSLCIYDLQKGSILRELHDHDGSISGVAWHRQSPWLLATVGDDCTLRLWDLRSHPAQSAIRRATKPYRHLEFSPDCNYIACAGELVSIYDLGMAQNVVRMLSSSSSTSVRFNPSECLLATADDDRTVRFWDVDTGECVTQTPTFNAQIGQIHFEPNGKYLIALTEKQIASVRWEPFELISQIDFIQPLHFPFSSNSHLQLDGTGNEHQRRLLLDVNVKNDRLNQLIVRQNTDPTKCTTVYSVCLSLSQVQKCGVATSPAGEVGCTPEERPPLFFGNAENLNKEEDVVTPEVVLSSSPSSLLDSLIIDQEEEDTADITEIGSKKDDPITQAMTNGRGKGALAHRGGVPCSVTYEMNPIPQLQRPNRLIIVPDNLNKNAADLSFFNNCANNSRHKRSLIRRGSSLNDVANCASASTSANTHNPPPAVQQSNTFALANTCVHQPHFSSPSTMSSSSSNASSSTASSNRQTTSIKRSESEVRSLEEFMQVSQKLKASANKLKIEADSLFSGLDSIQLNKAEYIVNAVAYFEEIHIFAELLHDYLLLPREHSLALCAAFLPRVEILLKHRNDEYPQMALEFIEMVLTAYGEAIRHGLSSRDFSIGVDVAAEQRFERCTKCKNALLQMRMNSSYCVDRLDRNQRQRFDNMMSLVDNL